MAGWRRVALQHFRVPYNGFHMCRELRELCGNMRDFSTSATLAAKETFDDGQPTFETHPELLAFGEIMPGISSQEFSLRRQKLREILPAGSLVILASATVKQMTDAVPYPYRQDADYLYFTGCQQPGGIAIINDSFDLCMFMPDRTPELLPDFIRRAKTVLLDTSSQRRVFWSLPEFQEAMQQQKVQAIQRYTHQIRWIKSPSEIKRMREVAVITCQAFMQTMLVSTRWPHERVLAATVEYECKNRGAQRMSFPSVVGGGANASVIHYSRNDKQVRLSYCKECKRVIEHGNMVLMDAGCELHGYVSDMTRCWPPSGTFSDAQREVYEMVLVAMKECFKLCRPDVTLREIHMQSGLLLSRGLLKLGLIKNGNSIGRTYLSFNPSAVGHYLGMDVHDCAAVSLDVPLQSGVIITIEPALYIPVKETIPERYRGIGVRIEDEVLITPTGHEVGFTKTASSNGLYHGGALLVVSEVLTASVPKEVEDIESWLAQGWSSTHHQTKFSTMPVPP